MKNTEMSPEFIIKAPFLEGLIAELRNLKSEVEELKTKLNPQKEYYTLKEACMMKNVNEGSLANKAYAYLRPKGGEPDAYIGTKAQWRWVTIQEWLKQDDDEMARLYIK